ncbi:type I-E CRISPR-associated protein Cas6/Cse3/CasE [Salmonella enterica]|nr:type I-E CRISPR-associated protein Cas6/Cse3/CasE [Salmonella enterica]EKT1325842.1 type I-E CRISPR-associated protein Cas6/Cse3/CasE [Salmonella enterica]EKT1358936.1 type I-E CRISPR-associated protein Cas6/Cse3/CasE [Salmonella enterica]EKT2635434.1 type I-E CRISPR-associated protein Cas6/Cse3/CasE [Salmonella enterica]EKT3223960.1 type I-E CRISPR-associated protein Cas6/Cse3/CasE [Salmonella enterica]
MIFYENALRLRIPYHDIYRIHQNLDFFIQEKCRVRMPYSFKIMPASAGSNDAAVFFRTMQSLALPGERKKDVLLKTGDIARFTTSLAVIQHRIEGNKQITLPPERIEEYARKRLEGAGFRVQTLVADETHNVIVKSRKTTRGPSILIPAAVIHTTCSVTSVEEAEKALVYGIGKKRIFGFGFLEAFRVNGTDEFF